VAGCSAGLLRCRAISARRQERCKRTVRGRPGRPGPGPGRMPAAQQVPMPAQHRLRPTSCPPGRENRVRPPPQGPGQLPRSDRRQDRHPEDLTAPLPEPPARLLTAWGFCFLGSRSSCLRRLLAPQLEKCPATSASSMTRSTPASSLPRRPGGNGARPCARTRTTGSDCRYARRRRTCLNHRSRLEAGTVQLLRVLRMLPHATGPGRPPTGERGVCVTDDRPPGRRSR